MTENHKSNEEIALRQEIKNGIKKMTEVSSEESVISDEEIDLIAGLIAKGDSALQLTYQMLQAQQKLPSDFETPVVRFSRRKNNGQGPFAYSSAHHEILIFLPVLIMIVKGKNADTEIELSVDPKDGPYLKMTLEQFVFLAMGHEAFHAADQKKSVPSMTLANPWLALNDERTGELRAMEWEIELAKAARFPENFVKDYTDFLKIIKNRLTQFPKA